MYSPSLAVYRMFFLVWSLTVCISQILDCALMYPTGLFNTVAAGVFAYYIISYCWPSSLSFLSLKLVHNSIVCPVDWGQITLWVGIEETRWVYLVVFRETLYLDFFSKYNTAGLSSDSPSWPFQKNIFYNYTTHNRILTVQHWHLFHGKSCISYYWQHHSMQTLCFEEAAYGLLCCRFCPTVQSEHYCHLMCFDRGHNRTHCVWLQCTWCSSKELQKHLLRRTKILEGKRRASRLSSEQVFR